MSDAKSVVWSAVSGELAIELYGNDGEAVDTIFDAHDDQPIPAITPDMVPKIKEDSYDLVIEFLASGYYDAGKTYGPPENCYPPEGYEERVPSRAYLIHYVKVSDNVPRKIDSQLYRNHLHTRRKEIELSPETMDELFKHFQTRIEKVEVSDGYR